MVYSLLIPPTVDWREYTEAEEKTKALAQRILRECEEQGLSWAVVRYLPNMLETLIESTLGKDDYRRPFKN